MSVTENLVKIKVPRWSDQQQENLTFWLNEIGATNQHVSNSDHFQNLLRLYNVHTALRALDFGSAEVIDLAVSKENDLFEKLMALLEGDKATGAAALGITSAQILEFVKTSSYYTIFAFHNLVNSEAVQATQILEITGQQLIDFARTNGDEKCNYLAMLLKPDLAVGAQNLGVTGAKVIEFACTQSYSAHRRFAKLLASDVAAGAVILTNKEKVREELLSCAALGIEDRASNLATLLNVNVANQTNKLGITFYQMKKFAYTQSKEKVQELVDKIQFATDNKPAFEQQHLVGDIMVNTCLDCNITAGDFRAMLAPHSQSRVPEGTGVLPCTITNALYIA